MYFCVLAAQLPFRRQPRDPLDELVVENRDANFQRVQHAHPVHFGENVGDHIGLGVDVKQLADRIVRGRLREIAQQYILGIVALAQYLPESHRTAVARPLERGHEMRVRPHIVPATAG